MTYFSETGIRGGQGTQFQYVKWVQQTRLIPRWSRSQQAMSSRLRSNSNRFCLSISIYATEKKKNKAKTDNQQKKHIPTNQIIKSLSSRTWQCNSHCCVCRLMVWWKDKNENTLETIDKHAWSQLTFRTSLYRRVFYHECLIKRCSLRFTQAMLIICLRSIVCLVKAKHRKKDIRR